jgi:hypothetical protein
VTHLRLLAVDLGSRLCGWAYFVGPDLVGAGTWDLEPPRHQSRGVRWLRLTANLDAILAGGNPVDLVAYEEVRRHESFPADRKGKAGIPNFGAAHAYGGAVATLEAWVARNRAPGCPPDDGMQVTSVTIADIKRAATGKGGGKGTDKEAVYLAAERRWPRHFQVGNRQEYDAADAAFVGLAALIELGIVAADAPAPKVPCETDTPTLF